MKPTDERPWGRFWTLYEPKMRSSMTELTHRDFVVKILQLDPWQRTSLQYHEGRNEVMKCVGGSGIATIPDPERPNDLAVFDIVVGYVFIVPKKGRHRLEAKEDGLTMVEIWNPRSGPEAMGRLDEDDIVRLNDDYGRAPQGRTKPKGPQEDDLD
jgi:mannose-6-phosphate isomerase